MLTNMKEPLKKEKVVKLIKYASLSNQNKMEFTAVELSQLHGKTASGLGLQIVGEGKLKLIVYY